MKPLSWFGAGQDGSFRRVRRTANVSSTANSGMAPTAIGTRFGRASRRGLSDVCQPQSSRIRISIVSHTNLSSKDELDGASASPDLELVRERGGPR